MTDHADPPTVTAAFDDVAQVAQYAKTYAEPGVHNAACRLLSALRTIRDTQPTGPNREGCKDPDCIRIECLHLGTCWEDAFWDDGPTDVVVGQPVAEGSYEWYRRELERNRALLVEAHRHLRVAHRIGRHDDWGPGYTCAGCALVERIDTHLRSTQSPQDGQTPANPYPSEGQETTEAQEASQ